MVSKAGQTVHFGFPMKEAVWRTNHGYDPKIRAHYMWNTTSHAYPWSLQRYMFIHDALVEYENQKVPIGKWVCRCQGFQYMVRDLRRFW